MTSQHVPSGQPCPTHQSTQLPRSARQRRSIQTIIPHSTITHRQVPRLTSMRHRPLDSQCLSNPSVNSSFAHHLDIRWPMTGPHPCRSKFDSSTMISIRRPWSRPSPPFLVGQSPESPDSCCCIILSRPIIVSCSLKVTRPPSIRVFDTPNAEIRFSFTQG